MRRIEELSIEQEWDEYILDQILGCRKGRIPRGISVLEFTKAHMEFDARSDEIVNEISSIRNHRNVPLRFTLLKEA